ncbi:sterol desaturase family [Diaporthe amygdali]|uniref:sterol desaturase family n=1 Tax=Phomopsis amygdali TaxID=1214568 RepID=UPI0022FDD8EC|nr:sterol desaturase family [Diaporthe amygdali]KAJ0115457.1 sterol desaturase family [Diaporthe amygdali]
MMDILLSLPILSVFLGGSLTSWSTSLNLLFFYMTWSTLVLSHNPLYVELFGTLAIRLVFFLVPSLVFLLFDTLLPSLSESIKYGGASALPPRDARALGTALVLALLNVVLETALEAGTSLGLTLLFGHVPFKTTTTLPLPWAIVKQLGWLYVSREALTYYVHKTVLHSSAHAWTRRAPLRSSRGWVAKQHSRFAHSRSAAPYSLSLAADHPVPFLLHRFAPVYLPALAVRPHLLVYFLFVGLITLEETLTMSGYTVVPGIIMGGIAKRNATHYGAGHRGASSGNYGAWGVLDWGCGTGMGGRDIEDDVRSEAEKHQVRERGERKASDAAALVQNGIDNIRKGGKKKGKRSSGSD